MQTGKKLLLAFVAAACMGGCSTAPKTESAAMPESEKSASLTDKVLEKLGLKKPEAPETPDKPDVELPDRRIKWRLAASDALNLNAQGQPVALLTRIYKLKSADAFLKAPYEVFGDNTKEKELFGEDLIDSRDLQLLPGQHYERTDKAPRTANFVGIVALYRAPSPSHWRFAFKADWAEVTGLTLGLHACAMQVQKGRPIGESVRTFQSTGVPCPKINPVATATARETQP